MEEKRKNKKESRRFTLKNKSGCARIFAVCLCVLLLASFAAQMISTQGGRIKVEEVTIDSRGAVLSAELYYPAGTSDEDKLPVILVAHGAGVTRGNYRGIAEELARRGFVVMNINGYGTGFSEMPKYDERDMGIDMYDTWTTPSGILDALNYVRTFNFIDQTRIGIIGHSQGSRRAEYATLLDCGYLTFNDIMINVLHDTFGQSFTEEEIGLDADMLAAERLNGDQMEFYNYLKEQNREWFDTRVHSLLLVGSSALNSGPMQAVEVAGHEVMRNCRMNMGLINGIYDSTAFASDETTLEAFHIADTETEVTTDKWYMLDDVGESSTIIGDFYGSVLENEQLQSSLKEHTTRLVSFNVETHSKEFFSKDTTQDIVKYFEQTLSYNGGELGASDAHPVDAHNIVFFMREALNFTAMLAMLAMLIPLTGLLVNTPFFASCVGVNESNPTVYGKTRYWVINALAVVFGFFAIYKINGIFAPGLPNTKLFPLFPSWWLTPFFLGILALLSFGELAAVHVLDKKKYGRSYLNGLNVKLGFVNIMKTILLAFILFVSAYLSLAAVKYLFNQDYRLWMFAFEEMKAEHWLDVLKYAVLSFPELLLIGGIVNYAPRKDIPEWLDDLMTVVFNSLGVWLCCIINTIIIYNDLPKMCNFTSTYGFLLSVPIVTYLIRCMYKRTRSIWLGAAISALILGWVLATNIGYNIYYPQTFLTNFLYI